MRADDSSVKTYNNINILYEDNHLLVVIKPVNMPVQEDSSGDLDCLNALKAYIKEKYNKPGAVYLGLIHRLDRPVGGVMVFARTSKAAARLSAQIRGGTFFKSYDLVVRGNPKAGLYETWLLWDERTRTARITDENDTGAKRALLECTPLETCGELCLCRVELLTGRHHQIRAQMASMGTPIWGDARYGNGEKGQQIALWAGRLTFLHPTLGTEMEFSIKPEAYPFSLFNSIFL